MKKMSRISARIPTYLAECLSTFAQATDRSEEDLIRRAITDLLMSQSLPLGTADVSRGTWTVEDAREMGRKLMRGLSLKRPYVSIEKVGAKLRRRARKAEALEQASLGRATRKRRGSSKER